MKQNIKRLLCSLSAVAIVVSGSSLAAVAPAAAATSCTTKVDPKTGKVTYGSGCKVDGPTGKPSSPVKARPGTGGAPPRPVQPVIVWDSNWMPGWSSCQDPDVENLPPEEREMIGRMVHTPRWSPPSDKPFPADVQQYTRHCWPQPAPGAPLPPRPIIPAPPQPNWPAMTAAGQGQMEIPAGDIWTNFDSELGVAIITGALTEFGIENLNDGSMREAFSFGPFSGEVWVELRSIEWTCNGTPCGEGREGSWTFQSKGDGTATLTATMIWEFGGYFYGPQGDYYQFPDVLLPPQVTTHTQPLDELIAARTDGR